ncbi:MAG: hypothetical protein H7175_25840 [Burkholderiales bacterium]|nr:hypothetical protein [Anaerolineae bacterium]
MHLSNLWRYLLWLTVVWAAVANRRHYKMRTTWLPHLITNTITLLLPDVCRALLPPKGSREARKQPLVPAVLIEMVRDNPQYAVYVTPLALGYILSHPHYNIYKGKAGEIRLAGFGLDALPHGSTAFALTALTYDTVKVAARLDKTRSPFGYMLDWGAKNPALFSATVLALVTLNWEAGEYFIYKQEMAVYGDKSKINMQWSMSDTVRDTIINFTGWFLAVLWRGNSKT